MVLLVSAAKEELGRYAGEALGVGCIPSALGMARLLVERQPSAVLMVGTATRYRNGPPIGTAVAARRIGFTDGVAALGLGYVPRPPVPFACDPRLYRRLAAPAADVISLPAVTTDPMLAERLSDGWQVEQLEAYGVAMACHKAQVPFAAVFGITGSAGPDAHASWLTHRGIAREAARQALLPLLDVGAEFFASLDEQEE